MMEFDDWWDDEREKTVKKYVMMGAFALRNIAWCAWNDGRDQWVSVKDRLPEMKTITKRAKMVSVKWNKEQYIRLTSEYQCPICHTIYKGTLTTLITRFLCDCGQELIVERNSRYD